MAGIGKLFKKGKKPPDPPRKDYDTRSRSQGNDSDEDSYSDPTKIHPTLPPSSSGAVMPSYPPPRPQHSPKGSERKINGNYSKRSSYPSENDNRPPVKPRPSKRPGREVTAKPTGICDDYSDPWDATKPVPNNDDYCDPVDANPNIAKPPGKLDDYSDPWDSTKPNPTAPPRTRKPGVKDEYVDPWDARGVEKRQSSKDSDEDSYSEPYDAGKVTALDEQAKSLSLRGMRLPSQGEGVQSPTADTRPQDDYDSPWESKGLIKPPQMSMSSSIPPYSQSKDEDSRPVDDYDKPWEWTARKTQQFGLISNTPIPTPQSSIPTPQATPQIDSRPADDYDSPWEYKRSSQLVSMVIDDRSVKPPEQSSIPLPANAPPKPPRAYGVGETDFEVDPDLPLVKQSWYHGPITRVEAERMLKYEEDGSFLVRDSESSKMDYSLSFKNNNAFMHLKISPDANQKYVLGQFSKPFDTVPGVIQHYTLNKLNIRGAEHKYLKHPVCPQHEYFVLVFS